MIQRIPPQEKTAKQEPPQVLIDLVMVRQMAERKRQLAALRKMIAEKQEAAR